MSKCGILNEIYSISTQKMHFIALNKFCWKYTNTFLSDTKKSNKEMHFY